MKEYLEPTYFIDSQSPEVSAFVGEKILPGMREREKGVSLFYGVRDGIRYNPYALSFKKEEYRGSYLLGRGNGFCIQKAILLAAVARNAGIPSRLNFANVTNHLATGNLIRMMKSDLFVFHGSTEMFLEGKWVKATPAFNFSLCEKFHVHPLEFDGISDSLFHPYNKEGKKHMEYVHDYGSFADFPFEMMVGEMKKYYPHLFTDGAQSGLGGGDFESEAAAENRQG